jgi:hypothetical protein
LVGKGSIFNCSGGGINGQIVVNRRGCAGRIQIVLQHKGKTSTAVEEKETYNKAKN